MSEYLNEFLSRVVEAEEQYKKRVQDASRVFQKEVYNGFFKPVLDKHPIIGRFTWTQYTPYFNDGEPCEFGVHDLNVVTQRDVDDQDDDRETSVIFYGPDPNVVAYVFDNNPAPLKAVFDAIKEDAWAKKYYKTFEAWAANQVTGYDKYTKEEVEQAIAAKTDINEVQKIFNKFPEDVMRNAFGDGVMVIVDRNGITVEDYDHE